MKSFASDNYAGAHPEVLAALVAANEGHAVSYGADAWTARAEEVLQSHFGPAARSRMVTITQSTELGTRYGPGEIAALARTAHDHGLLVHVDGSRLANAAAGLGCGLGAMSARRRAGRVERPRSSCYLHEFS